MIVLFDINTDKLGNLLQKNYNKQVEERIYFFQNFLFIQNNKFFLFNECKNSGVVSEIKLFNAMRHLKNCHCMELKVS